MDRETRDRLSSSAHFTLRNLLLGIHGIGSMLYWTDANTEQPYDFVGEAGLALEAMATLANECMDVEIGVENWEIFAAEKEKPQVSRPDR
jgi:hypothetical protein